MKYCPDTRQFSSVKEMNEWLIESWNSVVGPTDEVHLLGDLSFAESNGMSVEYIFNALKGRKHFTVGNHDEKNKRVLKLPWESVSWLRKIRDQYTDDDGVIHKVRAVACHYPLETWEGAHHGTIMLHGHSHGSLKRVIPHRFDVGVDAEGPFPKPLREYWERALAQEFEAQDHHGD